MILNRFSMLELIAISFIIMWQVNSLPSFPQLGHIQTNTPPSVQAQAVLSLIKRTVGSRSTEFNIVIDSSIGPNEKDTFRLSTIKGETGTNISVLIEGTTGVAATMGFYHYLKYFCHSQFTWAGSNLHLPVPLPMLSSKLNVTTNDRFRYYKNVCTESYSFAFWQWERWEREIDWMALHGINMPLAFTGQEAIFQRLYLNIGITQKELDGFFGGPAFLAWARMGNIKGWGGPLPQMWITNQLVLQHRILQRMRSLGMTPVLPAFAGFVPKNITRMFPKANVTRNTSWGHFNATFSETYLLDSHDPLYQKIGSSFIQEMTKEYGTDHIYNADTFNEMVPKSGNLSYLAASGKAVFAAMTTGDSQAVWLMQGWLFGYSKFWTPPRVKALVTSVPLGRMIILDLYSEVNPLYLKFESYYGQPFIWCMLNNFGGINELYGAIDSVNTGPIGGRKFLNSSMIGIGLTPEGINVNEVMFEFMMEHAWRQEPRDITAWVADYALQRYGSVNPKLAQAWALLMSSVYNSTDPRHGGRRQILIMRPSPTNAPDLWFKPSDLFSVWETFLNASTSPDLSSGQLFRYDLTDITRDSLQVIFSQLYVDMINAFQANDTSQVQKVGTQLIDLLVDMDRLLGANERFLVGRWINDAKSWGTDAEEKKLLEYNARIQITLWGPEGEILDYAGKQWAGVVGDYYIPRWKFFTQWLIQLIQKGRRFDSYIFGEHILSEVEVPWTMNQTIYPTKASGDTVAISHELFSKYKPLFRNSAVDKLYKILMTHTKKEEKPELFTKFLL